MNGEATGWVHQSGVEAGSAKGSAREGADLHLEESSGGVTSPTLPQGHTRAVKLREGSSAIGSACWPRTAFHQCRSAFLRGY